MKASFKNRVVNSAKVKGLKLLKISTVVVPIAAIVYSNLDKYVQVVPEKVVLETIKLTAGGVAAVSVAMVYALSSVKPKFSWIFMGIIFGILYLIQPVIKDLVLFTGIAFAGMTVNHIFIDGAIENIQRFGDMQTDAYIHAEVNEKITKAQQKREYKEKMKLQRLAETQSRYRP